MLSNGISAANWGQYRFSDGKVAGTFSDGRSSARLSPARVTGGEVAGVWGVTFSNDRSLEKINPF